MLESCIISFFSKYSLNPESLLIGVSGGRDSVALLCAIRELGERLGIKRLGAVHINHCLREDESDRDQEFVESLCRDLCVELFTKRLGEFPENKGIEEWARLERYRILTELLSEQGFDYAATAHTMNDQAETLIMRLVRGSGISGLRGILPVRDDRIIRPIIKLSRKEVTLWLKKRGIGWRDDSTNSDTEFKRNLVRHEIIPVIEKGFNRAVENISATAERMESGDRIIQEVFREWYSGCVKRDKQGGFLIKKSDLSLNGRYRYEELARSFRFFGIDFDNNDLNRVFKVLGKTGKTLLLKGGWRVYSDRDTLEFSRDDDFRGYREEVGEKQAEDIQLLLSDSGTCTALGMQIFWGPSDFPKGYDRSNRIVWIDRDKTGDRLEIRRYSDHLEFRPLGRLEDSTLRRYAKKLRCDRRVVREGVVVTIPTGRVVWIPGIALSEDFKISRTTERVAFLSIERPE